MTNARTRYPRTHRLLTAEHYQRVFKGCEKKAGDGQIRVLAASNDFSHPRLGTIVSIRNAGNAVQRNRIKRAIRESFRQHTRLLGTLDIIVLCKPGIAARSNQQIFGALSRHWNSLV